MFANPLALLALGLLTLPILIHLLARLKGRRVLFPTTKYLRATESHRLKLTRIERWPLLFTRLLACGLLVLAISNPSLLEVSGKSRAVLLLIDSSLSMNTEAAKEQARSRAREAIASLSADDVAAVARFDDSIKLLCDFTTDRESLDRGIADYGPRYGATDFSAILTWANKKLAALPYQKELILISDLQAANLYSSEPSLLSGIDLRIIRVEAAHRINAVPGSIATRATGDSIEIESTALLSEGSRTTITPVSFKIARRETQVSEAQVSAIANESNASLSAKIEGNLIAGAITTNMADEFDADDSRFFVAHLPSEEKILLVQSRLVTSDQAAFIDKALRASSEARPLVRQVERSESLPESADPLARYSMVIAPIEALIKTGVAAARKYVSSGGSLIITVGTETDSAIAAQRLDELVRTSSPISLNTIDATGSLGLMSPALTADDYIAQVAPLIKAEDVTELSSVRFRAAHSVHASDGDVLLRYSNDEPAAVRFSMDAGDVLILGFGLSDKDSTLARSPVYPTFIEWLTARTAANPRAEHFTIGQASTSHLLRGLTGLTRLYSIKGPTLEVMADNQSALAEPGVYKAEYQTGKIVFALNPPGAEAMLEQATESQALDRITIVKTPIEARKAAQAEQGIGLWRALAIGALVMSLIELAYKRVASDKREEEATDE
jgi:hypothetical protein